MVAFIRASLVLASLLVPATFAAPAGTIATPFGKYPTANVYAVPKGGKIEHVGNEIRVLDSTGNVVHTAQNDGGGAMTKPDGYAYAYWSNTGGSPISTLNAALDVPTLPDTNHGQSVFLFNSIAPSGRHTILAPTLQYGLTAAGGGARWSVASWYLVADMVFFTPAIGVSPGKSLGGAITLTNAFDGRFNYLASFSGIVGTELPVVGAEQLIFASEGVLAFDILSRSDYPSGSVVFSPISVNTPGGIPAVSWVPTNDTGAGLVATVDIQGASNASVTINFPG